MPVKKKAAPKRKKAKNNAGSYLTRKKTKTSQLDSAFNYTKKKRKKKK